MKSIKILGVKVNNITMEETMRMLDNFIVSRKPHQIVTLNPEIVMSAQSDNVTKNIINSADLVIPDGVGLLWAASFKGQKISERVAGIDLVYNIAQLAAQKKYSIYFLGATRGVAKKTSEILLNKFPCFKIAGVSDDSPNFDQVTLPKYKFPYNNRITDIKSGLSDHNSKIAQQIRHSKPDILLVAYGHPKQELFINRYKNILNVPIMIGVGGSFDFISGKAMRAPKIFQKLGFNYLGFEWLWRLIVEPWRWRRIYTAVVVFPIFVIIDKLINIDK